MEMGMGTERKMRLSLGFCGPAGVSLRGWGIVVRRKEGLVCRGHGDLVVEAARLRKRGLASEALKLLEDRGARGSADTRVLNELVLALLGTDGLAAAEDAVEKSNAGRDVVTYNVLIGAARKLPAREALDVASNFFAMMLQEGIIPSALSLSYLFQMCSKLSAGDTAYQAWCKATAVGSKLDVVAGTALLNCFAKSAQISRAEQVFDEMQKAGIEPNERTYAALMDAYAKTGGPKKALEIFDQLRAVAASSSNGLAPDFVSFCVALHCHALIGDVDGARSTLQELLEAGHTPNHIVYNCILEACAKGGRIDDALDVVQEVNSRNGMLQEGSVISLIEACGKCGEPLRGAEVLEACKAKQRRWQKAYNALVATYARCGGAEMAVKAFEEMERAGVKPDIVAYNVLVSSLAKAGDAKRAFKVLLIAKANGIEADVASYNSVVSAAAARGDVQTALDSIDRLRSSGLEPDGITWRSLLRTLLKADMAQEASDLLLRTAALGTTDDYALVLSACSSDNAVTLVSHMYRSGLPLDAKIISALIDLVTREGTEVGRRLLDALIEISNDPTATLVAYDAVMDALRAFSTQARSATTRRHTADNRARKTKVPRPLAQNSDPRACNQLVVKLCSTSRVNDALKVRNNMRSVGLKVDEPAYTAIVTALGAEGRLEKAFRIIGEMEEDSRSEDELDLGAYVALITACGKLGQLDRAAEVLTRVRDLKMQPNLAMYNAFLYSAGMLKKPNLAFSILNDLQRDGLQPDVITLSALGSVCLNNHIQDRRALNLLISLESLPEATSNKKVRLKAKRLRAILLPDR